MNLEAAKSALKRGLTKSEITICRHIKSVEKCNKTRGIEGKFRDSFERQLRKEGFKYKPEIQLKCIGAPQCYLGRKRGFVDCYIPATKTAFEYKAVRMPRLKSGALFDLGQLGADFLRLHHARKLNKGYIIVFVYGPLLQATSPGRLYQAFHNQMFVDFTIAMKNPHKKGEPTKKDIKEWAGQLGWNAVWSKSRTRHKHVAVAIGRLGRLGAICIDCRA